MLCAPVQKNREMGKRAGERSNGRAVQRESGVMVQRRCTMGLNSYIYPKLSYVRYQLNYKSFSFRGEYQKTANSSELLKRILEIRVSYVFTN